MTLQPALPNMENLTRKPGIEDILALAVEKSAGADAIERLVALQQQLLAKEAETEFNEAMNSVQAELRPVQTDLENPQTRSKYASYWALDRKIRPIYTKHGFALSFGTTDCPIQDHIRVLCHVSRSGHTRVYQCDMPADGKGAKGGDVMTKTHAAGAAMSYGMRYLLKMIFNIAVGEDDDDGNGGGVDSERLEYIQNSKDKAELSTLYKSAVADAIERKCYSAIGVYQNARDAKLKEWQ
jgi:hypothetical protein